jgi:hypothetical protein
MALKIITDIEMDLTPHGMAGITLLLCLVVILAEVTAVVHALHHPLYHAPLLPLRHIAENTDYQRTVPPTITFLLPTASTMWIENGTRKGKLGATQTIAVITGLMIIAHIDP